MGRRRCCCGCWSASDNFNRADSTNIGSRWVECNGDWYITENQLGVTGIGDTLFLQRPPRSVNGIGEVYLRDLTPGRIYSIVYGDGFWNEPYCRNDPEEIRYELQFETYEVGGMLRLVRVAAGEGESIVAYEQIADLSPNPRLSLCASPERLSGWIDGATYPVIDCGQATGHWWGLASRGTGEHLFDNWRLTEHYAQNPDCPMCWCGCDGFCMPDRLRYTFVDDSYCTHLDGVTGHLDGPGGCVWESDPIDDICYDDFNGLFEPFRLRLTNLDSGNEYTPAVGGWRLGAPRSPVGDPEIFHGESLEGSLCDPLYLKFGPFSFTDNPMDGLCCEGYWPTEQIEDGQSGSFYVVVTL